MERIPLGTYSQGGGYLSPRRWQLSLNYRWFRSHRAFQGTDEIEIIRKEGAEPITITHQLNVAATYAVSERLNLTVNVPFLVAKRVIPGALIRLLDGVPNYPDQISYGKGIGDVSVTANWWLLKPHNEAHQNISLGIGVKFPTGNSNAKDTFQTPDGKVKKSVERQVQPGDGGFGIVLNAQGFKVVRGFTLFASGVYLVSPKNTNDTPTDSPIPSEKFLSVTDQYLARFGTVLPIHLIRGLAFNIGGRFEGVPVRDLIGGSDGARLPGNTLSVEPGATYSRRGDTWYLSIPIAVRRNAKPSVAQERLGLPGSSAFSDYSILFGYSHRF